MITNSSIKNYIFGKNRTMAFKTKMYSMSLKSH